MKTHTIDFSAESGQRGITSAPNNDTKTASASVSPSRRYGVVKGLLTASFLIFAVLIAGCKDDIAGGMLVECDLTPPLAGSMTPTCGSTGVALNQTVTAGFTEVIEPSSLTTTTVLLAGPDGTPVTGSVVYVSETNIVTFTPSGNLTPFTNYTYTIRGGNNGIQDLFGNTLLNDFTCTFTTGAAPDTTAPTVTATEPANAATGVMLNSAVAATFSEAINPLTITTTSFIVRGPGSTSVSGAVSYAGPSASAVFNPTEALLPNTTYTGTITTAATDLVGNHLASDYVWTFTTGSAVDTTAPLVLSTDPAHLEVGVALNKNVAASFNEAMDQLTITTTSFTMKQGLTPVMGSVSYAGVTATFNPTNDFAPSTTYTATITADATDLAGNPLASAHVWTFTTGAALDTTAPVVVSTVPANLAVDVALNNNVAASFSEAMDPTTITASTFALTQGLTPVLGSISYLGTTLTFNPSSDFTPSTTYTATVTTDATDLAGNPLASDYVWTFTTGAALDTTAPEVLSTDPVDLEIGVVLNKNVTARFSEAMDPTTITSAVFSVRQGVAPLLGSVSYVGTTATFNPLSDFLPSTTYTATITTGATDLAGNPLASNYVWSFTTAAALDTTAPEVLSTDPADLEIGVALNKNVSADFSELMDPLTISDASFTLMDGVTPVLGSVSYLGTTATFDPTSDFAPSTTYTATITTDATDVAGNPLASDYVWSFTTSGPAGPLAVDMTCAEGKAVLAGATITSTGPSIINGDVAMSPGSALIGFPPGVINGVVNINDTTANNAKGCLTVAYNDAAGRAPGAAVSGNIGGLTLAPGVYTAGSGLAISSGDLTLDAQGDANGVFIFQIPTSLTVTAGRQVFLIGGAQAKNVFWQVGSSATLGTTSIMMGTIMADQAITLETGATLNGAALARIAAVSLDAATINVQ